MPEIMRVGVWDEIQSPRLFFLKTANLPTTTHTWQTLKEALYNLANSSFYAFVQHSFNTL